MISKRILMSLACSLVALSPAANAVELEKSLGSTATPGAFRAQAATPAQDGRAQGKEAFPSERNGSTADRQPSNPTQRAVSTDARQIDFVAQAAKAKSEKANGDKPSEQPSASAASSSGARGGQGGAANPIAAQIDPGARAMAVVASAKKAKSEMVNGDKPSEQPSGSGSGARSAARGGGRGGGGFARLNDRSGALSPSGRGSPGERRSTRCNARGMCF